MLNKKDIAILREVAAKYASYAALPCQEEKRRLWRDHNEFRAARPMVLIDQICWNEINTDGALTGRVEDPYWRSIEEGLLRQMYCWEHMPADMVLTPYISVPKPVSYSGWGLTLEEDTLMPDKNANAASHSYYDVLSSMEELESKVHFPEWTLDVERMKVIREEADVIFDGIIPYVMAGAGLHLGLWDTISMWRGVENCYIDLLDEPEFIHAIMEKMTQGALHMIETMNRLGIYDNTSTIVHCSHTFLDNLPAPDSDPEFGTTGQGWCFGMAQLFSSVSPAITKEFEVDYMNRLFPHFGAVYYGCCERLDDRLDVIEKLVNVRKISCSPWSDKEAFAEKLPARRIMSAKPNPAFLATNSFDEAAMRAEIRQTIAAARRHNRNLEFILKDISTIRYDQKRLWRWAEIAMEEARG